MASKSAPDRQSNNNKQTGGGQLSNLQKRILSALVAGPVFLGSMYLGGGYFGIVLVAVFVLMVREWFLLTDHRDDFPAFWRNFGYVVAIALVLQASWLRHAFESGQSGWFFTFYLVGAVWACDICAYIFGRLLKGPLLIPTISPHKTWAGFIAGMAGAVVFSWLFFSYYFAHGLALWQQIVLGLIIAVLAHAGDLIVSLVKRRLEVKDSGHIIPGHGGILDRVDSFLLTTPFMGTIAIVFGGALS